MKKIYGDIGIDLIAKNDKNLAVLNRMDFWIWIRDFIKSIPKFKESKKQDKF